MTLIQEAAASKQRNVIDMAIMFIATNRVFEAGARHRIAERLARILPALSETPDSGAFEASHDQFCRWFMQEIRTAERVLENGAVKTSRNATYGHAAKIFDIVAWQAIIKEDDGDDWKKIVSRRRRFNHRLDGRHTARADFRGGRGDDSSLLMSPLLYGHDVGFYRR